MGVGARAHSHGEGGGETPKSPRLDSEWGGETLVAFIPALDVLSIRVELIRVLNSLVTNSWRGAGCQAGPPLISQKRPPLLRFLADHSYEKQPDLPYLHLHSLHENESHPTNQLPDIPFSELG